MKKIVICAILVFTLGMLAFAVDEHPQEMGNMECIACHGDPDQVDKPEVVEQYNKSMHSFAGVACGNCHGDEKDFMAVPTKAACEPCHSEQVAVTNSTLPCQSCHVVHTYNVHMK